VYSNGRGGYTAAVVTGWKADGKPVRRTTTVRTKAQGRTWIAEAVAAVEQGMQPPNLRHKLRDWLDEWLALAAVSTSASTVRTYRSRVRLYVNPHLGDIPLRLLTPAHVARWLDALDRQGLAPATRQAAYSTLRRALTVAQQHGLVVRNVAAIADGPRKDDRSARSATLEEMRALREVGDVDEVALDGRRRSGPRPRLAKAAVVLTGTGLRKGELLGLRWSDVTLDGDHPHLVVNQQVQRVTGEGLVFGPTKGRRKRRVPLAPFVVTALRDHHRVQAGDRLAAGPSWLDMDLVFCTALGGPIDPRNFNTALNRLADRSGIGTMNPHALRHGAVSLLMAEEVPVEMVSEVAGHSSIRVTKDVYGHIAPARLDVASDAMERALGTRPTATARATARAAASGEG
jgi:integrase